MYLLLFSMGFHCFFFFFFFNRFLNDLLKNNCSNGIFASDSSINHPILKLKPGDMSDFFTPYINGKKKKKRELGTEEQEMCLRMIDEILFTKTRRFERLNSFISY